MRSATEPTAAASSPAVSHLRVRLERWNRKLHYYAGLIFMVLSSLYMWWELPQKRLYGVVALGLGSVVCGLFCIGLRWLF